jgi:hypothetical protein
VCLFSHFFFICILLCNVPQGSKRSLTRQGTLANLPGGRDESEEDGIELRAAMARQESEAERGLQVRVAADGVAVAGWQWYDCVWLLVAVILVVVWWNLELFWPSSERVCDQGSMIWGIGDGAAGVRGGAGAAGACGGLGINSCGMAVVRLCLSACCGHFGGRLVEFGAVLAEF